MVGRKNNSHATTDLKKPPDVSALFKRKCQYLKIVLLILDDSRFYVHPSAAWFCSWLSRLGYVITIAENRLQCHPAQLTKHSIKRN